MAASTTCAVREHIGLRLMRQMIRHAADPRTRTSVALVSERRAVDLLRAYTRAVLRPKGLL